MYTWSPSNAVLGLFLGATVLAVTEGEVVDILVMANSTFEYPLTVTVQLVPGSADGEGEGNATKGRESAVH